MNASVDVFQRVLFDKMAAFVQLAVFGVVLDLVVYRQTSTVVDTPQKALLWVWSDRTVEDMANKLFVMIGVLLLIKRDLFTFSSGAVALYLKSWNEYTKKLCNHYSYRFHPPAEGTMFLIISFLSRLISWDIAHLYVSINVWETNQMSHRK